MKKLIIITIVLLSASIMQAQEKRSKLINYTPEEAATLQTKKMTLRLDLTEKQQKEVYPLFLEAAKERQLIVKERKKLNAAPNTLSKAERFKKRSARLDSKIDMKAKLKEILTQEQYEKLENMTHKKRRAIREKRTLKKQEMQQE